MNIVKKTIFPNDIFEDLEKKGTKSFILIGIILFLSVSVHFSKNNGSMEN